MQYRLIVKIKCVAWFQFMFVSDEIKTDISLEFVSFHLLLLIETYILQKLLFSILGTDFGLGFESEVKAYSQITNRVCSLKNFKILIFCIYL